MRSAVGWPTPARAENGRRTKTSGLDEKAKGPADQARALVVNGAMSPHEATALLWETAWSVLLAKPVPPYEE